MNELKAATYWINGATPTHAGSNQTSTISVTAMKRIGNGTEQVDSGENGAVIWYNNDGNWRSRLGGSDAANCHTLNFNLEDFKDNHDIKLILTHDKAWEPEDLTTSNDIHVEDWEVITYSPTTYPVIDLSKDSAQIQYTADGTAAKNEVSSTAALYLTGQKLTSTNISYSWEVTSGKCTFKDNTNTETITITALITDSATVTCTISINADGIDGKFKNTSYQKAFSITKVKDGEQGPQGETGPQGKSVVSSTRYYALVKNTPAKPQGLRTESEFTETYADGTKVTWSKAPLEYTDEAKNNGLQYYESVITLYDDNSWQWSTPVKQTVLDVDFIKSIAVTTDELYAVEAKVNNLRVTKDGGDPNKDEDLIFKADGRALDNSGTNGPKSDDDRVKIGGFKLAGKSLWSTNTNAGSYFGPITTDSFTIDNPETGNITTLSGQERVAIATGIWKSDGSFTAESMLHGGDIIGENISGKFVQARRIESDYLSIDKTFSCGKVSIEGGRESDSFVRCSGLKSNYRRTDDQVGEFSDNAIILNFKGTETYYRFKLSLSERQLTLNFQSKSGYSSSSTWQNIAFNGSGGTLTIYYSTKGWGWPIVLGKKNNASKEIDLAKIKDSSGVSFTAEGEGDVYSYYIYDRCAPSSRSTTLDWITDTSDKAFDIGITGNVLPTATANNAGPTGSGYNLGSGSNVWNTVYRREASTSSDRRIKKEINYDLSKYDDFFDSLQPASYKYTNNTSNRVHVGFIAQDIEQELFNNNLNRQDLAIIDIAGEGFDASSDTILDNDKTSYFVRYDQLHALNVYQIQKLKKRVSEQEATIKLLEDRIKALEEKIK